MQTNKTSLPFFFFFFFSSYHSAGIFISVFAKLEGQVTNALRAGLNREGLVVGESMVLAFHARMFHKGSRVRRQAAGRAAQVLVYLHDLLNA